MSTPARLLTTVIAGLAGFAAVGIYTLLSGPVETYLDVTMLMILFTTVYVPGVFGARRLLHLYAMQAFQSASASTR
jgi:hypothetical protein